MGILNVTPDSFSDGGAYLAEEHLLAQVTRMVEAGADIIDVGGESTRPFAEPVSEAEELARVLPALHCIRQVTDLPISIDTTKAEVARQALAAGATMINDIAAFRQDEQMLDVAQSCDCSVVVMHMQGTPGTMQKNPHYDDVIAEVCAFFEERLAWLERGGISRQRVILDPGIGFGKALEHNLTILANIGSFKHLGCPVLIGHSRKSFFEKLLGLPIEQRDWPTAVLSALCAGDGADILRVHDVEKTVLALRLQQAVRHSS